MLAAASAVALCAGMLVRQAAADDQTKPGAGNVAAITLAKRSPMVSSAYQFLLEQAERIREVVNWLRAGAIIAQIDPVAAGYLYVDTVGNLRLPPLRQLGNNVNLNTAGQTNVLAEYTLHNLSDADFTYSGPAVDIDNVLLQSIAPQFGINPADPNYNLIFRNPVFSFFTAERLTIIYSEQGIGGVEKSVQKLRDAGII
jgi:hypothetical protein